MIRFSAILNIEMAMKAVEKNGYALQYVPEAIITEAVAMKAVENEGYALQYVLSLELFLRIAKKFKIQTDCQEHAA